MSMWNKHISKFLSAYVHSELDKMNEDEVRSHLDGCRRCRDKLVVIREGIRLASQLRRAEAPEAIFQGIEDSLAESRKRPLNVESRSWRQRMPVLQLNRPRVAAIALLMTIT